MKHVIGIDLGGTNMQVGVVRADGKIVGRCKRKTRAQLGMRRVVERVVSAANAACADAQIGIEDVYAIGIGVPGAIDVPRGLVLAAVHLHWVDVPIRDILSAEFGRTVVVDNDVNVAIWGEAQLGAGRGVSDVLGVWVGTGVGGGLVLNGQLYHGARHTAGELGTSTFSVFAGPGRRTLEQHASRTGMLQNLEWLAIQNPDSPLVRLRESRRKIGSKQIAEALKAGDEVAAEIVEHAASSLGVAIANVVTLLSLPAVVLGGGIVEAIGEPFVDLVNASFGRFVFPPSLRSSRILMTQLGRDAGVLGAALLARQADSCCIVAADS